VASSSSTPPLPLQHPGGDDAAPGAAADYDDCGREEEWEEEWEEAERPRGGRTPSHDRMMYVIRVH
jgi:hypothetical protein